MRMFIFAFTLAALTGCGAETASTAATGAAIKQREIEEGKKTMQQTREKIDQTMEQVQRRAEKDTEK